METVATKHTGWDTNMKIKEIGIRLRQRRKQLDFTMKEVAEQVGVSENYISEIERGKGKIPSDEVLTRIAEVYQIEELDLFSAFDKLPKGITSALERSETLKRTLYDIEKSKELSDAEKDVLYDEIQKLYVDLLIKKHRGGEK